MFGHFVFFTFLLLIMLRTSGCSAQEGEPEIVPPPGANALTFEPTAAAISMTPARNSRYTSQLVFGQTDNVAYVSAKTFLNEQAEILRNFVRCTAYDWTIDDDLQ